MLSHDVKLTWSFLDISNFSHISPFWGRATSISYGIFSSFFWAQHWSNQYFWNNNPFTFCLVVKRNKLRVIWHSHNVTFASFCEPAVFEVLTLPQNTSFTCLHKPSFEMTFFWRENFVLFDWFRGDIAFIWRLWRILWNKYWAKVSWPLHLCYSKLLMTHLAPFEEIEDKVKQLFLIAETWSQKAH